MKKSSFIISIVSLVLFIFTWIMYGCEEINPEAVTGDELTSDNPNNSNKKPGTLIVRITDAPFPIDQIKEANVIIHKIEIRKEDEKESAPYLTLSEKTDTFNLIHLRNGLTEEIVKLDIPDGRYDQLRLYTGDATIVLTDGKVFKLKIPSGAQSGIKMFIDTALVVAGGLTTELLLDFDLERSFNVQGNPNTPAGIKGFHFSPVIRAVNNTKAGRLTGLVKNDSLKVLPDAKVWLKRDTIVSSTFTGKDGSYSLIGIPAGTYSAFATKTGYDTVSVSNVKIAVAGQTTLNFTLKARK
jgi:hypothetical protein